MVSITLSIVALGLGFLVYLIPPAFAALAGINVQRKIGNFYFDLSAKSFKQVALVRRMLSGYELLPIGVNDEEKHAQVTLSSGILGDDKKLPFKDPDQRIKRWCNKPFAIVPETVPAAVDAELSELGYWWARHDEENGIVSNGKVQSYFTGETGHRLIDPMDAVYLLVKDAEPESVETAKQLTKQRFSKYGNRLGLSETVGVVGGYIAGAGIVMVVRYVQTNVIEGGGGGMGGGSPVPVPMGDLSPMLDVVATLA